MKYYAKVAETAYEIDTRDGEDATVLAWMGGEERETRLEPLDRAADLYLLFVDNKSYEVTIERGSRGYVVRLGGRKFQVELENEDARRLRKLIKVEDERRGRVEVRAPMPGLIVDIRVQEGERVEKGTPLFVIEAMKMENEIRSEAPGIVKQILRKKKDSVEKDAPVMVIE